MKIKFKRTCLIIVALAVIFTGVAIFNCIDEWYVSNKLGNNYVFTSDNGILYQIGRHDYFVIPYGITSISHDAKWIIAKTTGLNASYKKSQKQYNNGSQYWIINKEAPIVKIDSVNSLNMMLINSYEYPIISNGLIGPLDSVSFNKKLKKLRINLTLREDSQ